jgi:hypothetical protein
VTDQGLFYGMMAIFGFFIIIFLILGIVMYILASLGLYKLAVNRRLENPWLAWIPIGNLYILGKLIINLKIDSFEIPNIELVLPIGALITGFFGEVPFIGWVLRIAYFVLFIFSLYKLYKMYRPQQATLWLILSIVLPFMGPIFVFIMRDDRPIEQ